MYEVTEWFYAVETMRLECESCAEAHGELPCCCVEVVWLKTTVPRAGDGEHASKCTSVVSSLSVAPVSEVCRLDREEERGTCLGEPQS